MTFDVYSVGSSWFIAALLRLACEGVGLLEKTIARGLRA